MPKTDADKKAKKKRFGKINAVPVKKSKSDKKNGLRDLLKIPVVTSFPALFSLRPKRSDFPKSRSVIFSTITAKQTAKTPVILPKNESNRKPVKTWGNTEKPCIGRVISDRNNNKNPPKNRF